MRVGILDILSLPSRHLASTVYHLVMTKQFASVTPVPGENSIRVAYRAFGATARGFNSLAYIRDVPCASVT